MPKPLRIVHVVHSLELGGLENGVVNLLNRLDSEEFDHTLCCLTRSGAFVERIVNPSVRVIEIGSVNDGFRFPLIELAKVFRSLGADIVHSRGWGAIDAIFAARLARVPAVIHSEHGREWTDTEGANWKRNQIRRVVGCLVKRYVVVCDFFRPWLCERCGVKEEKILYIPNGVDTEKFHPVDSQAAVVDAQRPSRDFQLSKMSSPPSAASAEVARGALRRQIGLPSDIILIGCVGRLDPVKDAPTLLKSFGAIQNDLPEARLVIVGDGGLRTELMQLAQTLGLNGKVLWLGKRNDVPVLLRAIDIFVQSSLFEGMSNTILEAMASGLPIVATDAGGNGELVLHGVNGILFPVGDVEALSAGLRDYIGDPMLRDQHGLHGRQRALKQFDLSLMTERYGELYRDCVAALP